MNAQELFKLAPLGALVRFIDGTPRPPDRFKNKLRDWQGRNDSGHFIAAKPSRGKGEWDVDSFTLQTENGRVLVVNRTFGVARSVGTTFEVIPPAPRTILAYGDFENQIEVRHVWADVHAAQEWAIKNRYVLGKCGQKYFIVAADGSLQKWEAPE